MASQDWFEKDFYAILGVPQDADAATIKKAYRKLARTMHPDHNVGDAKAEERFKEIGEAYAVLCDPEKRREYDAIRAMSHGGARFTAGGAGGRRRRLRGHLLRVRRCRWARRRRPAGPVQHRRRRGQPNLEDILGQMFGGGGPGAGYGGYGAPSGPRAGSRRPGQHATSPSATPSRDRPSRSARPTSAASTPASPPGVKDGQRIRLRGKGRQGDPGAAGR